MATPDGLPVAMVHCNNCTTDLNAWVELFHQFLRAAKLPADKNTIYEAFFDQALIGQHDRVARDAEIRREHAARRQPCVGLQPAVGDQLPDLLEDLGLQARPLVHGDA